MTSPKPSRSFRAVKDPLYRKILEKLAGPLNPELFEECMGDLLRADFPGLVPVPGGNDAGMDGAIADGKGEPFPLVVTTSDVRRNLRQSLRSFATRGLGPQKAALATSRELTPAKRHGLFELARKEGFTLMQVFDQRAVADRLYHASHWRKTLLDLPGDPPALSIVPKTRRPLIDLEPVGREKDLEWLRTTSGDRVLSGEPGSGKTFLLHHLMRRGWNAFFLNSTNPGEIADAIRDLVPSVVVVDDAHAEPDFLTRLVQLRQDIGAEFSILATTWKGGEDNVREALGSLATNQVHRLELLTRDEIVEVFRQMGLGHLEANILRHLVNQAGNKPGLAVTIATLALQESWPEIIDGRALYRTFETFFDRFVGRETTDVLAALAIGGERGMPLEALREPLGLSTPQIRRTAAGLASAGVLKERGDGALAVQPDVLRYASLRAIYFPDKPVGLRLGGYLNLLVCAPSVGSAVETLVAARASGAAIPQQELRKLLLRDGTSAAWRTLAATSGDDALWVLGNYSGDVVDIARAALESAPDATIPRLFERAGDELKGTQLSPAMGVLKAWVEELRVSADETIERRRKLARAAAQYLRDGGRQVIGMQGICLALSPFLEATESDPGSGRTVRMLWGVVPAEHLQEIAHIWERVREVIVDIDALSWPYLKSMVWDWIHPEYVLKTSEVPTEIRETMLGFAIRLLKDLSGLARTSVGLAAGFRELAAQIPLDLELDPDPFFELLYPAELTELERMRQRRTDHDDAVRQLAQAWHQKEPQTVAEDIRRYEQEAARIGRKWPRKTPELCVEIAEFVSEPERWFDELFALQVAPDLLAPFLGRLVKLRREGWQNRLDQCLTADGYRWLALQEILQMEAPSDDLLKRTLAEIPGKLWPVDILCTQGKIPLPTLSRLLQLNDDKVALTAAIGEWLADPRGTVRPEIEREWRAAIVRAKAEADVGHLEYWFEEIFAQDRALAFQWLCTQLESSSLNLLPWISRNDRLDRAIAVLDQGQRSALVERMGDSRVPSGFVALVVGRDLEVYRTLLATSRRFDRHLEPLVGTPDEAWLNLALQARAIGYSPAVIVEPAFRDRYLISRAGCEALVERCEAFAQLEADSRPEAKEIARSGREIAESRLEEARQEARQLAIHGS